MSNSNRKIPDLGQGGGISAEALPTIQPNHPFLWAWHSGCWTVMNGELIPRLKTIPLIKGCNGVASRTDFASMLGMMASRGWNVIPQNKGPDGSYIIEVPVARGVAYISAWEFENPGSPITDIDEKGYVEWLKDLIASGDITECPRYIIQKMASEREVEVARLITLENSGNKVNVNLRVKLEEEAAMLNKKLETLPKREITRKKTQRKRPANLA